MLFTDLSKVFDCPFYELLLAKLHAHGFSLVALRLVHTLLTENKEQM